MRLAALPFILRYTILMTLCYYVTGHGYGHAIRSAQVLKALPRDVPIILKTTAPERLFREELGDRPFTYVRAEYDCGCIQPDSVTILKRETLDLYANIAARNETVLADEAKFLQDRGVGVVVADIAPFPFEAAHVAGVPSIAASNFTWTDIYRAYAVTDADRAMIAKMEAQYALATVALVSDMYTPTTLATFPNVEIAPLTCRIGTPSRPALDRHLNALLAGTSAESAPHTGLLYMGTWGLEIGWENVEALSDWRFVTYDPLDGPVANVATLSRAEWNYANTVASVDAMISKIGYGTVSDCIGNSVPEVHLPRRDFVEYDALVAGMDRWGGRVEMTEADFIAGKWGDALERALRVQMRAVFRTDGAQFIANRAVAMMRNNR